MIRVRWMIGMGLLIFWTVSGTVYGQVETGWQAGAFFNGGLSGPRISMDRMFQAGIKSALEPKAYLGRNAPNGQAGERAFPGYSSRIENESSPLAKALHDPEALRAAWMNFLSGDGMDSRGRLDREREFVMAMVRYMQQTRAYAPADHDRNLRFFSDLLGSVSNVRSVQIADATFSGFTAPFTVPEQFLKPGRRGALGAILDTLQGSSYVVRPQVRHWFERPAWLRWFDSAV
ncbi:MAG: hypothetical protein AB1439_00960 [candidate division FCPU426 bacterium]